MTQKFDNGVRAQTKATTFLKQNQKTIALSYLRSKKQLESVLEKRVGAVEQLRTVLRGIDNAQGDVEVSSRRDAGSGVERALPLLTRGRASYHS